MSATGINTDPVDRYTSSHAGIGATLAWLGAPAWMALLVSVGWELIENDLKDELPGMFPYASHDSLANSISDTLAVLAGWRLARASAESASKRERLGLAAAVGSTVAGGLLMPAVAAAYRAKGKDADHAVARRAYTAGNSMGAAIGSALELHRSGVRDWRAYGLQMSLTALGAGLGGPVGAAASGYIGGAELKRAGTFA